MVPSRQQARAWSRGLGWLSIGLGVIEVLTARPLSKHTGRRGQSALVRAYGLREIVTGVGLLNTKDPAPWMWARVAGDALDIATLVPGLRTRHREGAAIALAAVAGVALVDLACARSLSAAPREPAVDYSGRSGWPLPAQEMSGAALVDFQAPRDMRTPEALRTRKSASNGVDID